MSIRSLKLWLLVIAVLTAPARSPAQERTVTNGRMRQFQRALAHADRQLAHALSDGVYLQTFILRPDPYADILRMLHRNGEKPPAIPPAWQAHAWTRYAAYLQVFTSIGRHDQHGHSGAWYQKNMLRSLHQATHIDPTYGETWVALAYLHENAIAGKGSAKFKHYLANALRYDPQSANAQGMRASYIFGIHGGHGIKNGSRFTGNIGFASHKWTNAFRYRALMFLWCLRKSKGQPHFWPPALNKGWVITALKYYSPKQLAEVRNGTWKPDPSADPFPPPEKKAAPANTKAADQGRKSAGKPAG